MFVVSAPDVAVGAALLEFSWTSFGVIAEESANTVGALEELGEALCAS